MARRHALGSESCGTGAMTRQALTGCATDSVRPARPQDGALESDGSPVVALASTTTSGKATSSGESSRSEAGCFGLLLSAAFSVVPGDAADLSVSPFFGGASLACSERKKHRSLWSRRIELHRLKVPLRSGTKLIPATTGNVVHCDEKLA